MLRQKMNRSFRGVLSIWAIVLFIVCGELMGWTDDINPSSPPEGFSWDDCGYVYDWYLSNFDGKMYRAQVRAFNATTNLSSFTHAETNQGTDIAHWHNQYDFGPNYVGGTSEVDAFWNYLFWEGTKTQKISAATNKTNCHAYAFADYTSGGSYLYWMDNPTTSYSHDTDPKDDNEVAVNDLLKYGTGHTSVVKGVSSQKPSKLRWKVSSSGVYETKNGQLASGHEYDTPACAGTPLSGTEPEDRFGPWDDDIVGNDGDVYRDDES